MTHFFVNLGPYERFTVIKSWLIENKVNYWWNGGNPEVFCIETDTETFLVLKLKFNVKEA